MSQPAAPDRRTFLRTAAGGFAVGGMLGLGFDLRAAQAETAGGSSSPTPARCPASARTAPSAAGSSCRVRDGRIVNIEGNPDSPINRGTLCPKGAATYQLAVNPNRVTKVWYRAPARPSGTRRRRSTGRWTASPSDVKQTRDATFRRDRRRCPGRPDGEAEDRRVNHTPGHRLARRGDDGQRVELRPGEADAGAGRGRHREPGPDLTQLDRARSGHLVRAGRGHQPARWT